MTSPLERLAGPTGPLIPEPPDAREFAALCRSAEDHLSEARRTDIKLGARFLLAYAAAHGFCLAALRHKGYRARHRYIVAVKVIDIFGNDTMTLVPVSVG